MVKMKFDFKYLNYIFNNLVPFKKENKRLLVQYVYAAFRCWSEKKALGKFKDNDMKNPHIIKLSLSDLHEKFIKRIKRLQYGSLATGKEYFTIEMFEYLSTIKLSLFRNIVTTLNNLHLISVKTDRLFGNEYTLNTESYIFTQLHYEDYILSDDILKAYELEKTNKKLENVRTEKPNSDIEPCEVTESETNPKSKISNVFDIDIKSTSGEVAETNNTFDYDSMIANEKKAVCLSQVYVTIQKSFKDLNIKSKIIKERVIEKIDRNINNITLRFAEGYIKTTIAREKIDYDKKRDSYRKAMFANNYSSSKKSGFRDFPQRNYDVIALENQLLGLDEYNPRLLLRSE